MNDSVIKSALGGGENHILTSLRVALMQWCLMLFCFVYMNLKSQIKQEFDKNKSKA